LGQGPSSQHDDISLDALGKEKKYFSLHRERQLEVINFPVRKGLIYDTKEINKAPPYDSIFKSPKPLDYDFGKEKPIGYNTPPSPLPSSLVHHFESDSHACSHMISSDLDPFPLSKYSVKEEPLIEYSLSPWAPPQVHDQSITSPF